MFPVYQRILVINLMYIGDLLFTTPLVHLLRANFSDAHIAMLVDKKNSEVIQHNPHLSQVIAIDKKGYHNKLKNFIKLIQEIREQKFDLVINLHPNERASALAAFSGGKKIIGFSAKGFGLFFDHLLKERTDIHQADAYIDVLTALDNIQQYKHAGLEMGVDSSSRKKAQTMWESYLSKANPNKNSDFKVAAINTGGSWPTKRWTKDGFVQVADQLLQDGFGVVFFGGPMDREDVAAITQQMTEKESNKLAVFTGCTTLLEMSDLVRRCQVLISGDSGPMHIAVSQKVPVVAIFGPSDPVRYAPYGQKNAVISSQEPCLCCGQHQCEHHRCMRTISYQMVYAAAMQKLLGN